MKKMPKRLARFTKPVNYAGDVVWLDVPKAGLRGKFGAHTYTIHPPLAPAKKDRK